MMSIHPEFGFYKFHSYYLAASINRCYHDEDHPRALYFAIVNDELLSASNLSGIKAKIKEAKQ